MIDWNKVSFSGVQTGRFSSKTPNFYEREKGKIVWELIQSGWYCAKGVGGICQEYTNKWHCYPVDMEYSIPSIIFFKTLAEAKKWFEKRGGK